MVMLQLPYQVAGTQLSVRYTLSISYNYLQASNYLQGLLHHRCSPYKQGYKVLTPLYKYKVLSHPFHLSFSHNSRTNYCNFNVYFKRF